MSRKDRIKYRNHKNDAGHNNITMVNIISFHIKMPFFDNIDELIYSKTIYCTVHKYLPNTKM